MTHVSRRTFIQSLAALPLALAVPRLARAGDLMVRYDLASPQGQEMLAVFAHAVHRMETKYKDTSPMSWLWQWYTHFVNGDTTKTAEIERIFGSDNTARRQLAEDTWDTCQAHSGQDMNNFLPWHRMYVYYLERVVRRVTGRDDFTLPYWDYTSEDPAKRGVLPAEFRNPDDPVFGSLYRPDRRVTANSGEPIQGDRDNLMAIDGPMGQTDYEAVGVRVGFSRAINNGIHGRIHTLTGTGRGMGAVPYAGNDPLFWVHHANIDRMWASWNNNGGVNPADAQWAQTNFVFADAYGQVTAPQKDYFDCTTLGYGYDAYIPGPDVSMSKMSMALAGAAGVHPERVGQARSAAELGARPVRVTLLPVTGAHANAAALGLDPQRSGKRTYLVLKDLHTWSQPEVLYHVYVTPTRGGRLDDASYAGNINFFDAEFHDHGAGHDAMNMALGQNMYSFDITDLLQAVVRSGNPDARQALLVTFVPGGVPTPGAKPLVASIELMLQ